MKIAYLILCHKNPHQVERLINQLSTENTDFYLHIDKKVDNFNVTTKQNVYYVSEKDRVDVRWASISMVYATLALIKTAFSSKIEYDYFLLLSGQDYPIKSNQYIFDFLEKHRGTNYIQVLSHSDRMYNRYSKRNALYYPDWMFSQKTIIKALRKLYIYITGGYNHTFSIFRRRSNNITYEYGSQWWVLSRDCLHWIYNFLNRNNNINRLFGNSLTPDECVFQTAFMMSPYKNNHGDKVVYLEWDTNRNNPRIFTKADSIILTENNKCLFARKFDENVDSMVLDCLEKI